MSSIATLAGAHSRIAEIQSRFAPSSVRATTATRTIDTASFDDVISNLLGSTATDTEGSTIDLTSLTSVLSSLPTRRSGALASALGTTTGTSGNGPTGADAVAAAKLYLGVDYVWGGTDPSKGLDCSGLVQRAYRDLGIELPRVSYDQAKVGTKVDSIEQARPGDLVAFGSPVDHIGIYVGDGKMIQAPHTGDVVRISDIKRPITAIRRVIPDDAASASGINATSLADRGFFVREQGGRIGNTPCTADEVTSATHDVIQGQGTRNLASKVALRHCHEGNGHLLATGGGLGLADADLTVGVKAQELELCLGPAAQPSGRESAHFKISVSGHDVNGHGTT